MENIIIPSIDLYDRKCVRLKNGLFENFFFYSNNPFKVLLFIFNNYYERLHLVDLNSSRDNSYKNLNILKKIVFLRLLYKKTIIQFGGGVRSFKKIMFLKTIGIDYIIISTLLFNYNFFCFKNYKIIILAIDYFKGFIYTNAWLKKQSNIISYIENNVFNKQIICTDIERDGMLTGINSIFLFKIIKALKKKNNRLIVSGGISCLSDLVYLKKIGSNFRKFIYGAICGKSFYEKKVSIIKNVT